MNGLGRVNLKNYIDSQLNFFINKFIEIGWKREDLHYITKKIYSQNWNLGIVFYSELLEYREERKQVLTPWIVGMLEIKETDYHKLSKYADFIKEEVEKIGWKMFHDEDAFQGYFSKEENKGWTKLKFYINEEYSGGFWENHTL